jgi:probable rRNA maturation factor
VTVEVEVENEAWAEALPTCEAIVLQATTAALLFCHPGRSEAESRDPGPYAGPNPLGPGPALQAVRDDNMEVTVLLTDDAAVRALNARFRGKDAATNVLSFPAAESARPFLGDVALAFGTCAAEAGVQHKTLADHLAHLTVHGVLHLLGYDHEAAHEAEVMEEMERQILARLGVRDPYAWDADA